MGTSRFEPLSADRLLADLRELSTIGQEPSGGITRLAYTPTEQAARNWIAGKLRAMGLAVSVDALGNVEGRPARRHGGPADDVLSGSHFDSVLHGGRFDGALGLVCAIHAVQTIREAAPEAPVGVVAFAAEESTRFGTGCLGSRGLAGALAPDDLDRLVDDAGVSLRQALAALGLGTPDVTAARREPGTWARAFLELHIDQATDLQDAGVPVGIVTAIAAPLRLRVIVEGMASHSGATRMANRKDALAAAAAVILAVEGEGRRLEPSGAWTTVGNVRVEPGAFNTVPGRATLDVEIRAVDDRAMAAAMRAVQGRLRGVAADRGVEVSWTAVSRSTPAVVPSALVALLEEVCADLHVQAVPVVSRAAHDAMYAGQLAPAGMLLVRNRSGLSHSHLEEVDTEDILVGATVLAHAMWRLADQATV
ncbi:MAG: hydantoinase/carbamoylase family amidase [Armatimonadota bacterium]|nr:hydantoinase/carbamoylase family amidase [Armatimonadota bacterium]MDR7450047.1 hydantoinase/carbamoylase family amidase [Armatimonadota bacterium]MDR7478877.1 hydantoinase/carbamoylase family amidase [Armatimonadota bacterium]MDR7488281.1 hydantoinase/carbamoylase family amidase [Armatimonadota bacterium]MDR7502151.1 hydantoinase/carbamoylase family amidase [Armatimonadota bacterium]